MYKTKFILSLFLIFVFLSQIDAKVYMSVSGRAIDVETNEPVKGVSVRFYGEGTRIGLSKDVNLIWKDTTDENGFFKCNRFEAGKGLLLWEYRHKRLCFLRKDIVKFEVKPGKSW